MAKDKTEQYLVVVVPAPPVAPIGVGQSGFTYTLRADNKVRIVTAKSAAAAAEAVGVPPGATAYVAKYDAVTKMVRPETAPLQVA